MGNGVVEPTNFRQADAQAAVGLRVVGFDLQRLSYSAIISSRQFSLGQDIAQVAVIGCGLAFDFHCLPILDGGFGQSSAGSQGETQIVVGHGKVGMELEHFMVLGDGLTQPATPRQGEAQIVVGQFIVGLEFDRLLKLRDGLLVASARGERRARLP